MTGRSFIAFALLALTGCGGPGPTVSDGGIASGAGGGGTTLDGGDIGTGKPLGTFCTLAGSDGTCYGAAARVVSSTPSDGGWRQVQAIGAALGRGTQLRFDGPFGVSAAVPARGSAVYTISECANFACGARCQYGSADAGVPITGTIFQLDGDALEAHFETALLQPTTASTDAGCTELKLTIDIHLPAN